MGNYDFSPAVMKNYTPKMGLYICDVISQGNKVRVLYSYADKNGEYNIMEYDVSTQKIANQGSFTDKSIGTTLTNENILRFNGYNTIVNITKGSDKIITYTISE
jgi:hypothetical protein